MKDLSKFIERIEAAKNMVEVDSIISSFTWEFLEDYSRIKVCPSAKSGDPSAKYQYSLQQEWIKEATTYFKAEIESGRVELIQRIPNRFAHSEMYLALIATLPAKYYDQIADID